MLMFMALENKVSTVWADNNFATFYFLLAHSLCEALAESHLLKATTKGWPN